MKKKFVYLIFLTTLLLSSCSTKLDITGQYKETMVVYGLLDQSQTKQYIKVNKAFLGQGDAYTYAQVKDSTQYVHALNVKLQKLDATGNIITEKALSPDNSVPKDPGTFYAPDQANAIYSIDNTSLGAGFFSTSNSYRLIVANSETGTQASAQTNLISSIGQFVSPAPTSSANPVLSFIVTNNDNFRFFIKWNSGVNARIYQPAIRFNYIDSTILGSSAGNDTLHLDWSFPTQNTQGLGGNEAMDYDFVGQQFLQFIGSQLNGKPVPAIARRALKTEIHLTAGADDLNTYIEVNAPSTGIVQDKPIFTNITNGLGIFSARFNEPAVSRNLQCTTLDSLACGRYTKTLKFLNCVGILPNCN